MDRLQLGSRLACILSVVFFLLSLMFNAWSHPFYRADARLHPSSVIFPMDTASLFKRGANQPRTHAVIFGVQVGKRYHCVCL
ncbi:hypothetical protein BD769DRAFT_196839 [Suillus cothurnatus]|nr:hypothetical protein BD769DRAFT_196839 [Suillus cothurnatus]